MTSSLTEPDREQNLAELAEVHTAISKLSATLRRRYSAKLAVLKVMKSVGSGHEVVYCPSGRTLSSLCEAGLRSEIVNLKRKRGEVFPKRAGDLKAGRPVKTSQ